MNTDDRPDPAELTPEIEVQSIISSVTFEPYVQIRGSDRGQWTPEEARNFARDLFGAAAAAEYDAFLFHYLTKMGLTTQQVGKIVMAFRKMRGSSQPKDWRE